MAIEEYIQCRGCKRAVVPRIWFDDRKRLITYRKVEHLCPYCGSVMYVTGGGVNLKAVIFLLCIFSLCAVFLFAAVYLKR